MYWHWKRPKASPTKASGANEKTEEKAGAGTKAYREASREGPPSHEAKDIAGHMLVGPVRAGEVSPFDWQGGKPDKGRTMLWVCLPTQEVVHTKGGSSNHHRISIEGRKQPLLQRSNSRELNNIDTHDVELLSYGRPKHDKPSVSLFILK
jgi:hypothetical protein